MRLCVCLCLCRLHLHLHLVLGLRVCLRLSHLSLAVHGGVRVCEAESGTRVLGWIRVISECVIQLWMSSADATIRCRRDGWVSNDACRIGDVLGGQMRCSDVPLRQSLPCVCGREKRLLTRCVGLSR